MKPHNLAIETLQHNQDFLIKRIIQNENKNYQISEPNRKLNVYFLEYRFRRSQIVNTKFFFQNSNIRDNIIVEQIEGYLNYTTTNFDTYVIVRNQRNTLWNDSPIKDDAVALQRTKQNNSSRSSMITNQNGFSNTL